jgi:hypothetical protein
VHLYLNQLKFKKKSKMETKDLYKDRCLHEENGSLLPDSCDVHEGDCGFEIVDGNLESDNHICDEVINSRYDSKCDTIEVNFEIDKDEHGMHYKVSDVPNAVLCFAFGLQVILSVYKLSRMVITFAVLCVNECQFILC